MVVNLSQTFLEDSNQNSFSIGCGNLDQWLDPNKWERAWNLRLAIYFQKQHNKGIQVPMTYYEAGLMDVLEGIQEKYPHLIPGELDIHH